MPLVNTKEMFNKAYKEGYSVGAFNVDSYAMIQAVLGAAEEVKSPVIISISNGSREFMHPGNIKEIVELIAKDITIPYAIHLDHGKSVELCKAVIDEGFTSVMIDAGAYPFEEAIKITKEVVEYAHARNVTVEGELGPIKDILNQDPKYFKFTNPELAVRFIKETGIDSLAVSIGTGHGTQKFKENEEKTLQYDIIKEIDSLLPGFPLVLHGSSSIPESYLNRFNENGGELLHTQGIPSELLSKASKMSVCKINIGTDFRVAYVGGLRESLTNIKDRYEPRNFLVPAKSYAKELVKEKLTNVFLSAGHAK